MTEAPFFIETLSLAAFRAYLQPKTFNLGKKRCLAIFAPNGKGKSSVIDGLEFMFSDDGTLERLGVRAINNNAGVVALAHTRAEETTIIPAVSIDFIKGKTVTSGVRNVADGKRAIPEIAVTVKDCFKASPIIRGFELRTFVESHKPEQRYADVATWLQLGPLVEVQKNLRALRAQVKVATEDDSELDRIDKQLNKETAQAVAKWDETAIISYINDAVIAPLDKTLALSALDRDDPIYRELVARKKVEELEIGIAGLRQLRQTATALWAEITDDTTGEVHVIGAIPSFEAAVALLGDAVSKEAEEQGKAASAAFQALWTAAEPLFADDQSDMTVCPVCTTPIHETAAGSADVIHTYLSTRLEELADYATAKKVLDNAKKVAAAEQARLNAALRNLTGLLRDGDKWIEENLSAYTVAISAWIDGAAPTAQNIVGHLRKFIEVLNSVIADIEARQGNHTYAKACDQIDRLIELQTDRLLILSKRAELIQLSGALILQTSMVSDEIRKKVQALIDQLQTPMNDIYKSIQGDAAKPIRLELPAEGENNQQRLNLVIDFADNRLGVQPSGYLSDSQIHSVALALRLAAIKQFNPYAPIIALDDIVTSYDADHRRAIAGMIASMFSGYQILITTHDERFFNYLKDQLEDKDWNYTRIIGLDPAYGPRFADHKVSDEMIEARWHDGESAANEMRQAEEEWLLGICRGFGANVRIRTVEKAYSYERNELASALATFLKETALTPQLVAGVNNRFLNSLQTGTVENFGSHFQDAQYGAGSIGDEKTRWAEFKAFRSQFACSECTRTKFHRPIPLKKPVCAHDGCETKFEFAAGQAKAAAA